MSRVASMVLGVLLSPSLAGYADVAISQTNPSMSGGELVSRLIEIVRCEGKDRSLGPRTSGVLGFGAQPTPSKVIEEGDNDRGVTRGIYVITQADKTSLVIVRADSKIYWVVRASPAGELVKAIYLVVGASQSVREASAQEAEPILSAEKDFWRQWLVSGERGCKRAPSP